jgi:glycosyltransferase involved in cell wall biosynthesis
LQPRTSVVLPVYNGGRFLAEAIESILVQTDGDFELVIVDDGSTDDTPEIISRYGRADRRIRSVRQAHAGVAQAANRAIGEARGAYIARMDADDLAHLERVQRQADFLDEHSDTGLVASRVEYLGDPEANRGLAVFVEWNNSILTAEELAIHRFVETPVVQPSVMFRSELPSLFGPYRDGPFPEDYELWLRWLEHGVRMAKLPQLLLQWRETPGRLTRTDERYSVDAFYGIKAPYLFRWLATNNPHHPNVIIWGAGRTSRKRQCSLTKLGVRVQAYVDIDPDKIGYNIGGADVIWPEDLPAPADCFVLGWVSSRGAREEIEARLQARGFQRGRNYLPCA